MPAFYIVTLKHDAGCTRIQILDNGQWKYP